MKDLILKSKEGSKEALEEIIRAFNPLINNTALSFYIYGYEDEDIKQVARLAIIKAVNKFNIELIDSFPSYVKEVVRNTIYKEISKAEKVYFKEKISKEIAVVIDIKEIIDEEVDIQEDYIKKEKIKDLEKIISLLKEEERNLLKEIYVKRKTLKEYSENNNLEYHKCRYMKEKILKQLKDKLVEI